MARKLRPPHARVTRRGFLLGLGAAALAEGGQPANAQSARSDARRPPAPKESIAVGPTRAVKTIVQAARMVKPNGVIEVDGGLYKEAAAFSVPVTLRAAPGQHVRVDATGLRLPDDKSVFLFTQPSTIDGFEIWGAKGFNSDNAAAVRNYPAVDLTVLHCSFHHCQNGILVTGGNLTIRDSELHHNSSDAAEHNLYYAKFENVPLGTLLIERSSIYHAVWGNNVKSNALRTIVRDSYVGTHAVPKGTSFDPWLKPPPADPKLEWLANHNDPTTGKPCATRGGTCDGKEFDISFGGELLIENCHIFKAGSAGGYFIGYGFEGSHPGARSAIVRGCTFYKEREPCYIGNRVPNARLLVERSSFVGAYNDKPVILDTKLPNGTQVAGATIVLEGCTGS